MDHGRGAKLHLGWLKPGGRLAAWSERWCHGLDAKPESQRYGVDLPEAGPGLSMNTTEAQSAQTKVLTLSEVLLFLRRGAPLALIAMLLSIAVAIVVTRGMDPVYRASVSVVAARPPAAFGNLELVAPPPLDAQVYQSALLQGTIIRDALEDVTGQVPSSQQVEDLKKQLRITVDSQPVSSVIRIEVDHSSPSGAADYANAIANQLVAWDRDRARQFIDSTINALEQAVTELDAQLVAAIQEGTGAESQARQTLIASLREQRARELEAARARRASAVVVGSLNVLSPAMVPQEAIGPRLVFNTFVAAVLGLVLGYGAQFLRWAMRDEVANRRRLGEVTKLPVLADFPVRANLRGRASSEAASFFRANLLRELPESDPLIIGVASVVDYTEKEGVSAALAEKLASSGVDTLVVDCDLRRRGPGVGVTVKGTQVASTDEYLRGSVSTLQPLRVLVTQGASFDVIPAGAPTAQSSELLQAGIGNFLGSLGGVYDVVILDLPPALGFADAVTVGPHCTGVVLCAGVGTESRAAREAVELLGRSNAPLVGTVLTRSRSSVRDVGDSANVARENRRAVRATGGKGPAREQRAVARVRQR